MERAFFLDDADKALIARRRGDHIRLGFALQLTTVRYLGLFLADPLDVPNAVLEYLAEQMAVADRSCVKRYTERRSTRFEHAEEIRGVLTLRDFADAEPELTAWVDARAWTTGDGPKGIFNDAVAWLLDRRVLLPGVTTLGRLVAQVRDDATQRLWDSLYELVTAKQRAMLERLLGRSRRRSVLGSGTLAEGAGAAVGHEPGEGSHPGGRVAPDGASPVCRTCVSGPPGVMALELPIPLAWVQCLVCGVGWWHSMGGPMSIARPG